MDGLKGKMELNHDPNIPYLNILYFWKDIKNNEIIKLKEWSSKMLWVLHFCMKDLSVEIRTNDT